MRSRQLDKALTDYVTVAGAHLREELAAGAEVPFEVGSRGGGPGCAALYCYRALTGPFIAQRDAALKRLPQHAQAAKLLEGFEGLDHYLAAMGADVSRANRHTRACTALELFLDDVFDEQADFQPQEERLRGALQRVQSAGSATGAHTTLVGTLHGLAIASAELTLSKALAIARPGALEGLPAGAATTADISRGDGHLIVIHTSAEEDREPLVRARQDVFELLRALRLFGDGRLSLGVLGWARAGNAPWRALPLGAGPKRPGTLLVAPEQEDELRAFYNLVSRRSPREGELAWALRRFEMGCDRDDPLEALTDHLLALRVLLDPEDPAGGLLPRRLGALCADRDQRAALSARVCEAVEVERAAINGAALEQGRARRLADELSDHLRALLSDVIGGHLSPDVVGLADAMLAGEDAEQAATPPSEGSKEEVSADTDAESEQAPDQPVVV